jgi:hypothetical protein
MDSSAVLLQHSEHSWFSIFFTDTVLVLLDLSVIVY